MSGITCRNGLIFVAAIGLGLMVTSARSGSLDAPAGPNSPDSAMWTLEDIYKVLDTHTTNVTKRTSFKEPTNGPTTGTMHNLNDIMTLAKRAPVPKTGQTNTWVAGDDGTNQIGVAWPNPRFTVVGAPGTPETNQIRDNLTGLIWARNANLPGVKMDWTNAIQYCTTNVNPLSYGGTNDWRLPNVCEILSLTAWQYSSPAVCNTAGTAKWVANDPFVGVQSGDNYWTSTTYMPTAPPASAWVECWAYGNMNSVNKTTTNWLWPVRGGQ